jgi:hypothetical protein
MLLDAVKVDLARFFCCPFVIVLDARGTECYVGWENRLRPVHQEEG